MTITKKEIHQETIVTRGSGFNPKYSYFVKINGISFSKHFLDPNVYLPTGSEDVVLGQAYHIKDFVNVVYDYLKEVEERAKKPEVYKHCSTRSLLMVHAGDSAEAEEVAQNYLNNLQNSIYTVLYATECCEPNVWAVNYWTEDR